MAEIETTRLNKKKKKCNKNSTRVDLTSMVDLGFLLLTFFVFTTALSTPMAMNLVMPNDKIDTINDAVCQSCVLTVLLDEDNSIKYYEGAIENNPPIKKTGFAPEQIREVLMQKKAAVEKVRGNTNQFILIIKPSTASNFKNFVDITDEVTICQIKKYYVDELSQADKNILLRKL
jgi:biopolymer transport protein ExbD